MTATMMRHFLRLVENTGGQHLSEGGTGLPEFWTTVVVDGADVNVGWQIQKDQLNKTKHGLNLSAGIPVLESGEGLVEPPHSRDGEEREQITGPGANGIILVIVVCYINTGEARPAIRIISVRAAEPHERRIYMQEKKRLSEEVNKTAPEDDPENPPLRPGVKRMPFVQAWRKRVAAHRPKGDDAKTGNEIAQSRQPPGK